MTSTKDLGLKISIAHALLKRLESGWLRPLAVAGCITLFLFLPADAKLVFPIWSGIGLIFYFLYGYRKSHVARGIDTPVGGEDVIAPVRPLVDYSADNTSSKGRH